jgi:hypothetical protein
MEYLSKLWFIKFKKNHLMCGLEEDCSICDCLTIYPDHNCVQQKNCDGLNHNHLNRNCSSEKAKRYEHLRHIRLGREHVRQVKSFKYWSSTINLNKVDFERKSKPVKIISWNNSKYTANALLVSKTIFFCKACIWPFKILNAFSRCSAGSWSS